MASRPAAPSRPMPVSRHADRAARRTRARPTRTARRPRAGTSGASARGSAAAGRCRTTRWTSGGAITTRPAAALDAARRRARRRRGRPVCPSSQSAKAAPNGSPMCSTNRIGSGKRRRQAAQDLDERARAAGRGADGDHLAARATARSARRRRRRRAGRGGARRACQPGARMGDDADARDQLARSAMKLRSQSPSALVAARLLEHVDRAGGERVVGLEQLAAVGRRRDDQDRRRAVRHDVLGGGEAAHHRQHHVHRDDVGPQRAGTARSPACRRRPRRRPRCSGSAASTSHRRRRTVSESSTTSTRIGHASSDQRLDAGEQRRPDRTRP